MRISLELQGGEVVRVFGPARLTMLKGHVMILGAVFSEGESVEIDRYRSYAIKALEDSVVELQLGERGTLEKPAEGEEVIEKWVETADEIVSSEGAKTVLMLGPVDAGKSSFTALLANRGIQRGLRVGVIDADIGQADVGPPGFVSAAFVDRKILWLRWLRAQHLRFIGSNTPQRLERRIISAVVDLKHMLLEEGAELIAVDSDGWVHGIHAIEYKMELVRSLRPSHIVVVGDDQLYETVRGWVRSTKTRVYNVSQPSVVYVRDREDRRVLRSEAYRRFFENATVRKVKLDEVGVIGSCLLNGRPLPQDTLESLSRALGVRVIRGSETLDSIVLLVDSPPKPGALERLGYEKNVYIVKKGDEKGLYVALLDENLEERAPGVLLGIDYESLEAEIYTSYGGPIGAVMIGYLKLNVEEGFVEEGRAPRCPL